MAALTAPQWWPGAESHQGRARLACKTAYCPAPSLSILYPYFCSSPYFISFCIIVFSPYSSPYIFFYIARNVLNPFVSFLFFVVLLFVPFLCLFVFLRCSAAYCNAVRLRRCSKKTGNVNQLQMGNNVYPGLRRRAQLSLQSDPIALGVPNST